MGVLRVSKKKHQQINTMSNDVKTTDTPTTDSSTTEPAKKDDKTKPNLVKRLVTFLFSILLKLGLTTTVQLLLFLIGLIWLCCHQYLCLSTTEFKMRGTYFSEAALLTESARISYNLENANEASKLSQEYNKLETFATRMNWLDNALQNASPGRVHTYRHLFQSRSLDFDATVRSTSASDLSKRENVYAILEPRVGANRNEAIVLVAKHEASYETTRRTSNGPNGIGILISLLRLLSQQKWISKRIIIVMTDGGSNPKEWDGGLDIGARQFISDYTNGRLPATGGDIRGAILLDISSGTSLAELGVAMQGSNGLLTNLDLVNVLTMSRSARRRNACQIIDVTRIKNKKARSNQNKNKKWTKKYLQKYLSKKYLPTWLMNQLNTRHLNQPTWKNTIIGTFNFMTDVALGPIPGGHAHFLDHGIDAVTINTRPLSFSKSDESDLSSSSSSSLQIDSINCLGAHLEVVVRSMSSMSETFHQSFWLYILPSTNFMVTVEEYGILYFIFTFCVPLRLLTWLGQGRIVVNIQRIGMTVVFPFIIGSLMLGCVNYLRYHEKNQNEVGDVSDVGGLNDVGSMGEKSLRDRTQVLLLAFVMLWSILVLVLVSIGDGGSKRNENLEEEEEEEEEEENKISNNTTDTNQIANPDNDNTTAATTTTNTATLDKQKEQLPSIYKNEHQTEWKGTAIIITILFYLLHCFIIGIRNYSFGMLMNTIMIPLVLGMQPLFMVPSKKEVSLLTFYCSGITRILHSMVLLVTSPPIVGYYYIPFLWLQSDASGSMVQNTDVVTSWCGIIRSYYELNTFHLPYFLIFYIPFHVMICRVTWNSR